MTMVNINRSITVDELLELANMAENQKTADRFTSTEIHINGDFAEIDVAVDEYGNITLA